MARTSSIVRRYLVVAFAAVVLGLPLAAAAAGTAAPSSSSSGSAAADSPPPITGTVQLDEGSCPADPTQQPKAAANKWMAPWLAAILGKIITSYVIDPLAKKWEDDIEASQNKYSATLEGSTTHDLYLASRTKSNDARPLGFQCLRFYSGDGSGPYAPTAGHFFLMANLVPVATMTAGGYAAVGPAMAYEVKPVYARLNVADADQSSIGPGDFGIAVTVKMSTGSGANDWNGTSRLQPFNLRAGVDGLKDPTGDANASNRLILPAFPSDHGKALQVNVDVQVVENAKGWDKSLLSALETAIVCADSVADKIVGNAASGTKNDASTLAAACN